jgi:hypothetical protein
MTVTEAARERARSTAAPEARFDGMGCHATRVRGYRRVTPLLATRPKLEVALVLTKGKEPC